MWSDAAEPLYMLRLRRVLGGAAGTHRMPRAHICIDRELHGLAVLERAARAELAEVQHLPQPLHCNIANAGPGASEALS